MENQKTRKNWIDAAKAIAIFIVVLNHSDLRIPGVNFWGGMFFVSAFFVLSGYTYHVSACDFGAFFINKAKRLLVPYLIANVLLVGEGIAIRILSHELTNDYLYRSLLGVVYGRNQLYTTGKDPIYLMINLNAPTWFLPALFVSLVVMELLQRQFESNQKKVMLVVVLMCLVATIYHYFGAFLLPWSLDLMPFFLLMMMAGYKLKTTEILENSEAFSTGKKVVLAIILLIVLIASGLINQSCNLSLSYTGKSVTLMCLSNISSSILLMKLMKLLDEKLRYVTSFLAKVGKRTLFILCYHYIILMFLDSLILRKLGLHWMLVGGLSGSNAQKEALMVQIIKVEKLVIILITIGICVLLDIVVEKLLQKKRQSEAVG